ncbi:MAG: tRNA (adenosine(37)-N6)-threonylcarbamoyltransferase complex ATPase subunit type 1 TsaE [Clostridiales bacterium]|nr:tRNA (adenosine(37)-N6)-threonylcarbamoyltransferase complex ATPase subunit type 1 TsaE [Clostridiales bacterium]MCF8023339.1 tRNA (adenosine(37)-N6)-threonylcarbamoyltransferase complex ATPase subunit type 1 TsaE [Clostridiales bacterium]
MPEIKTGSPGGTELAGEHLGALAEQGDVFCLHGDLGAGKTCMARGIARGLNVRGQVNSPTFNLIKEYEGRIPVYHMDVYRLNSPEEMEDLGYEEYFYGSGVTLIEWPAKVQEILPENRLDIYIEKDSNCEHMRKIILIGKGGRYTRLAGELIDNVHIRN